MSEIKTNKISPRKGTTTTITDSGDTVTVTSGANINNAGNLTINNLTNSGTITSTGTLTTAGISGSGTINNTTGSIDGLQGAVNWQTGSIKTTAFTASVNEGYFCNTTSASFIVTLPASPSAGDVIGLKDYADTFDTNKLELNANGNKIQGSTTNFDITVEGTAAILLYVDSTKGWLLVDQSKAADIAGQVLFTVATGGTITTCGDFKIHTFTGPGTFCVSQVGNSPVAPTGGPGNVDYLVVAGGGSGGGGSNYYGGGGGAGGYRTTFPSPSCNAGAFPITAQAYPITVGAGGADATSPHQGQANPGSNSIFSSITSAGGGAGSGQNAGASGGSGGGAVSNGTLGGAGNTPPVSPSQGNPGGDAQPGNQNCNGGGGGGGIAAAGTDVTRSGGPGTGGVTTAGPGGNGSPNSITGSAVTRAGGGGGGVSLYPPGPGGNSNQHTRGTGGSGGGGDGGSTGPAGGSVATAGSVNTGSGGGGAGGNPCVGKAGGSGIVIIRYKFQ